MLKPVFILVSFTWSVASSMKWDGPVPTTVNDQVELKLSPTPISAHRGIFVPHWKRQTISALSTSNPGPTCGFLAGSTVIAYTCPSICAIATSYNLWGCCQATEGCILSTSCVASSLLASCALDSSCVQDQYLQKCNSVIPYCNKLVIQGAANAPVTHWQCEGTPTTVTLLATATDGNKSSIAYSFISIFISPMSTSIASITPSVITPQPTITTTVLPTTITSSPSVPAKAVPVGSIVGGVIGGLAFLAVVLLLAFLLIRRRRRPADVVTSREPHSVSEDFYNKPLETDYRQPAVSVEKHVYQLQNDSPAISGPSRPNPTHYHSAELDSPTPQYAPYAPPPPTAIYSMISEIDGTNVPSKAGHSKY